MSYIPDFFVVGAMKAGTSSLFRDFFVNDEILRTKGKEVNFMLEDLSWQELNDKYRTQYASSGLIKCDVSPKYSQWHNYEGVPARVFRANPEAKIIYITRDPIDRIISHLHHNLLRHRFPESKVNEEVLQDENYVMCSRYLFQINKFTEHFPTDRILILMLEEIKSDPEIFCKRLNNFLGLSSIRFTGKRFNVSEQRNKIMWHDPVHRLFRSKTFIRLYHNFWYFINLKVDKPKLSSEVVLKLKRELYDETHSFADAFGLDLKLWSNFK